jgi:septum formation protein
MKLPKLILASGSPRRAEILNSVGWKFDKLIADIEETELANEKPADYVLRLANEKADKVSQRVLNGLILGADTTVVIDQQIIGKPNDLADARRMLKLLSGREHKVLTGIALVNKESNQTEKRVKSISGLQETKVKFSKMTSDEIDFLTEKGEPLDKAGAYAVQAQAALFIEEIQGDYWNVVGLPINLVFRLVNELMNSKYSVS